MYEMRPENRLDGGRAMSIPVSCPCGKHLHAKDELAGKRAKCPACGRSLQVPAAQARPAPAGNPAAEKPAGAAVDPAPARGMQSWRSVLLAALGWVAIFGCCSFGLKLTQPRKPSGEELLNSLRNDPSPKKRAGAVRGVTLDFPGATDAFIEALADPDLEVRSAAFDRVYGAKLKAAVPALVERVRIEPDPHLHQRVCSLLAVLRDPRAVEPMIALLGDQERAASAADVLGELGDQRAAEPLYQAIAQARSQARRSGQLFTGGTLVLALAKLRDARAFDLLVELQNDSYNQPMVIEGLGKLGDARGVPVLLGLTSLGGAATIQAVKALDQLDPGWATKEPGIKFINERIAWLKRVSTGEDTGLLASILRGLGAAAHPQIRAVLDDPQATTAGQVLAAELSGGPKADAAIRGRLRQIVEQTKVEPVTRFRAAQMLLPSADRDARAAVLHLGREAVQPARSAEEKRLGGGLLVQIEDPVAGECLEECWQRKDLPVLLGGWVYYRMHKGEEALPLLIDALLGHGTPPLAEAFLNSGDARLAQAGETWAVNSGFWIKRSPNDRPPPGFRPGAILQPR